jgi:hypothetical protein
VKLVQKMPPQPSSVYADKGTMLHEAISEILSDRAIVVGQYKYKDITLTEELYAEKIVTALASLDEVDPHGDLVYEVETRVGFGDLLPGDDEFCNHRSGSLDPDPQFHLPRLQ